MTVKELKQGEFFTKKPIEYPKDNQVFIRKEYDKSSKKYVIQRYSDMNDYQLIAGNKEIFTDFIF